MSAGAQTSACVETDVAGSSPRSWLTPWMSLFMSCFARGAQCWSAPVFLGVLTPTLIFFYLFYLTQRKQRQISAGLKKPGSATIYWIIYIFFIFIYLFILFFKEEDINQLN